MDEYMYVHKCQRTHATIVNAHFEIWWKVTLQENHLSKIVLWTIELDSVCYGI